MEDAGKDKGGGSGSGEDADDATCREKIVDNNVAGSNHVNSPLVAIAVGDALVRPINVVDVGENNIICVDAHHAGVSCNVEVGMEFQTFQEAYMHCMMYAHQRGFDFVLKNTHYDNDGSGVRHVQRAKLACSRSGKAPNKPSDPFYSKRLTCKTDCGAFLNVRLCGQSKYIICRSNLEHNHDLLDQNMVKYLRKRKEASSAKRLCKGLNNKSGISLSNSMVSIAFEPGSYENLSFTHQGTKNSLRKSRNLTLGEGDSVAIQQYFCHMQARNNNFFYMMNLDADGCLRNLFWADSASRIAYKFFGNVILFDTTYLTGNYEMPLVLFIGVNNHGQSVLMGCALLCEESTDNLKWLFRTWLTCMDDVHPKGIITDQIEGVIEAVSCVFPSSRHRLCIWHIMQKLPHIFGDDEDVRKLLKDVICNTSTPAEFEAGWMKLVVEMQLHDNVWMCDMYGFRHMWVPAYFNDMFWAGITTIQRSESMKAFFDGCINSKTTIKHFFQQYEHAIQTKQEKHQKADFDSCFRTVLLKTLFRFEKQVRDVYTPAIFKLFQVEVLSMVYCRIGSTVVNNDDMSHLIKIDEYTGSKAVTFNVIYDKKTPSFLCSCRLFDTRGIMCRHCLFVMMQDGIDEIPPKYIVDHWRKDLKASFVKRDYPSHKVLDDPGQRYEDICSRILKFAEFGSLSNENHHLSISMLEKAFSDLMAAPKNTKENP